MVFDVFFWHLSNHFLTGLVATNGTADFVCMAIAKFSEKKPPKFFGIRFVEFFYEKELTKTTRD